MFTCSWTENEIDKRDILTRLHGLLTALCMRGIRGIWHFAYARVIPAQWKIAERAILYLDGESM